MIEHDLRVRHRVGERRQITELRVVHPCIERVATARQHAEALAKFRIGHLSGAAREGGIAHLRVRVPRGDVADAAEAPATRALECLEHGLDARTEREVRIADDAGDARLAVVAARRHRADAVDELYLADRLHLLRAVGFMEGVRLDEDGRQHIVA